LAGYAALAEATGITTPLLVWLPTSRREATARRQLHKAWRELDDPRAVPVATAAAELLNPEAAHPSPADEVWLPLDTTGTTAGGVSGAISAVFGSSTSSVDCSLGGNLASAGVAGYGPDQLANAATIVAVGKQLNVPEQGWVAALAAAMQESSLTNLDHGDRDS